MTNKRWRLGRWLAAIGFVLLIGLLTMVVTAWLWQKRTWDNIALIEIVSQLMLSVGGTSEVILRGFYLTCLLPTAAAMLLAVVLLVWLRRSRHLRRVLGFGSLCAGLALVGLGIYVADQLDVVGFVRSLHTDSAYIEDNYVDPASVELTYPERKRNLIYIWVESLESTYADPAHGGAFERNVIPELTELAEDHLSFAGSAGGVNGGVSTYGTTWTAGALFAQTTGLPLKIPITDNSMSYQEQFFPSVTALGDLLEDAGYEQALLIGSGASFGGRGTFFSTHGNYHIWDYHYAADNGLIPKDYHVWWGYEDRKLFAIARSKLTELAASGKPFNLSLLTADSHFPDGYVCPLCPEGWDLQYSRVMACASRQVADFVSWIQAQPFYENTTIVICGDHVTMETDYCDGIAPDYQRKTYTLILNAPLSPEDPDRARQYTTMDLFPTTLAALGVEIPGDRLALGTNLFSDTDTLLERDGLAKMDRELKQNSPLMHRLSGFDESLFRLSEALQNLTPRMETELDEETLRVRVYDLSDYDGRFEEVEVFAERVEGNTRTTIQMRVCTLEPDGAYLAEIPRKKLAGETSILLNIYALLPDGRIKVGQSRVFDLTTGTLADP